MKEVVGWHAMIPGPITGPDEALAFVTECGFCTWGPVPRLPFPNLAEAMGETATSVLECTWSWKDDLHFAQQLYYGKILAGQPSFIAPDYLPSRALSHKPPLEAYPGAIHSGRFYRPEWEEELLSLEKVCTYLAQGRWFHGVRSHGFFGRGRYQYSLGKHFAKPSVALRFDPEAMALICLPEGCEETIQLPVQGGTSAELMGELAVLQALPIYQ